MDPLSQSIAMLRPNAVQWRVIKAQGAWSLRFPPSEVVVFGQLIEGACRIDREDRAAFDAKAGDFMLMAAPPVWSMNACGGGPPVDFLSALAEPHLLLNASHPSPAARFIAGSFKFAAPNAENLARLMLPVIHVRGEEVATGRLRTLLKLLGDEALADRPGRSLFLDRLLEILLVEALRHRPTGRADPSRGLLAGLADPKIGEALRVMHECPQRSWTVATLARHVGMSRSSFAARFTDTVGLAPIDYLASWRMTLAKDALMSAKTPMADVAELAGYQSVSAFSAAFKRATGSSPSAYARSLPV